MRKCENCRGAKLMPRKDKGGVLAPCRMCSGVGEIPAYLADYLGDVFSGYIPEEQAYAAYDYIQAYLNAAKEN